MPASAVNLSRRSSYWHKTKSCIFVQRHMICLVRKIILSWRYLSFSLCEWTILGSWLLNMDRAEGTGIGERWRIYVLQQWLCFQVEYGQWRPSRKTKDRGPEWTITPKLCSHCKVRMERWSKCWGILKPCHQRISTRREKKDPPWDEDQDWTAYAITSTHGSYRRLSHDQMKDLTGPLLVNLGSNALRCDHIYGTFAPLYFQWGHLGSLWNLQTACRKRIWTSFKTIQSLEFSPMWSAAGQSTIAIEWTPPIEGQLNGKRQFVTDKENVPRVKLWDI
jgi:hypothetical protein